MANCATCKANCERAGQHRVKTDCVSYVPKDYPKPRTNYDSIVSKSPEELADYLAERSVAPNCIGKCHNDYEVYGELRTFCHNCWLDWLEQEVEDD